MERLRRDSLNFGQRFSHSFYFDFFMGNKHLFTLMMNGSVYRCLKVEMETNLVHPTNI